MLKPSVQIHNMDGILVAEFWDCLRLDPAPVQDIRKHYEAHVQKQGRPELVVDLSGVGFAGSAALGNFVALHRLVRQHGGRIVFCNVDPTVSEVFRASKLESLFGFESDRDAALHAILELPRSSESGDKGPRAGTPPDRSPDRSRRAAAVEPPARIRLDPERAWTRTRSPPDDRRPPGRTATFFAAFPLIEVRPATMIAGRWRREGSVARARGVPRRTAMNRKPSAGRADTRTLRGGSG